MVEIKICGVRELEHALLARKHGAKFIGMVFFKNSKRNISLQQASVLSNGLNASIVKIGLVVNATNFFLEKIQKYVALDMFQLHGSETPDRVMEIKAFTGKPVVKAIAISSKEDLKKLNEYESVCEKLLVDSKPSKTSLAPGGTGMPFDWQLLRGRTWDKPWMLAGGLTVENVGKAVETTDAKIVDISSGVENSSGEKCPKKIIAFCDAVKRIGNVKK